MSEDMFNRFLYHLNICLLVSNFGELVNEKFHIAFKSHINFQMGILCDGSKVAKTQEGKISAQNLVTHIFIHNFLYCCDVMPYNVQPHMWGGPCRA